MRSGPAIIDDWRNVVSQFYSDHHDRQWFVDGAEYLKERRKFVQKRFAESRRYVEIHAENSAAFSYEFAGILRDCGSIFSSVLEAMIRGSNFTGKTKQTTITDYRQFLIKVNPRIYLSSVHVRSRFPDGLILPLYSLKNAINPGSWKDFNKVKHSEYDEFRSGKLGSAAAALAALVILETIFAQPAGDEIWTNVGMRYHENSYDMQSMKRIFPNSE